MKNLIFLLIFIPIVSFSQNDSTKFIDNFYLEFSAGPGVYSSLDNYFKNEFSTIINSKIYYKNKRFKLGVNYGCLFVWSGYIDPIYSYESWINILSKKDFPHSFGPSVAYGFFLKKIGQPLGHRFIKFGMDYFYDKFHVAANYKWIAFENAPFKKGNYKTTNIYVEIGYAFNLESFRKKK